jgi:hypothetical protein
VSNSHDRVVNHGDLDTDRLSSGIYGGLWGCQGRHLREAMPRAADANGSN